MDFFDPPKLINPLEEIKLLNEEEVDEVAEEVDAAAEELEPEDFKGGK